MRQPALVAILARREGRAQWPSVDPDTRLTARVAILARREGRAQVLIQIRDGKHALVAILARREGRAQLLEYLWGPGKAECCDPRPARGPGAEDIDDDVGARGLSVAILARREGRAQSLSFVGAAGLG